MPLVNLSSSVVLKFRSNNIVITSNIETRPRWSLIDAFFITDRLSFLLTTVTTFSLNLSLQDLVSSLVVYLAKFCQIFGLIAFLFREL